LHAVDHDIRGPVPPPSSALWLALLLGGCCGGGAYDGCSTAYRAASRRWPSTA